jgi:hypothetical protein
VSSRGTVLVLSAVLASAVAGCVTPAPTTAAYEAKAAMSAEDAVSAVRTALLSEDTYRRGRLTAASLETVLVESEEALDSVRTTFASVQPPEAAGADALRAELDPLLEEAGSGLADLRIAARRDRRDDLATAADELTAVADELEAFGQEHAP